MKQIALVTGASSGFGRMIANELAAAGHVAYASMRGLSGKNAAQRDEIAGYARQNGVDLRAVDLDVQDDASVARAIASIVDEQSRINVLVHNAGHMVYGPSEAFTPEQLAELYDVNVVGTQRVNRAVLPHMRAAGRGFVVWVGSTSVAGGVPPLLGPYFAAKAGMDALAVCYAKELAPLGIETSIVVPGAFTTGTNHFAHAGKPGDEQRAQAYEEALPRGFADAIKAALAETVPDSANPSAVGRAVRDLVAMPHGSRPLRVHIDPADDGAAVVFAVMDRVREQFLARLGFSQLHHSR